ncbi:MAG: FGGY family carbohydrate kinase, partial [Ruthenibacterium sp.]
MTKSFTSKETFLGIELGSTRIKAVLIDASHQVLASGAHDWESKQKNGYWTYALEDVWTGIQKAYSKLAAQVLQVYAKPLTQVGAIGISGMMHGYLAFDADENQLVPFRTWRNTTTEPAAQQLTELFRFN